MPASAQAVVSQSVRPSPSSHQPHANGPSSRSMINGTQPTHNRLHKSTTSADSSDPRQQQRNVDMYSKPLPSAPNRESARLSKSTPMMDADRYKPQSTQKSLEKDYPPTPSSHGHSSSLSSSHGNTYTASQSSHASSSSMGRHRSATVAASNGLDVSTSSSSSAQGHGKLRRKPVRPIEDTPSEHFKWEPGSEPMMLVSPTDEAIPMTSSSGRRNRSVGIYRDAPGSATLPPNAQATYSRATGASAASSTKTLGQERYVLQEAHPTSLGRHHHSAHASLPGAGSARTTVQTYFPGTDGGASSNQDRLVYKASSSNGHNSGNASANSSTPTPKAHAFATTPTPSKHASKQYNLSVSASDLAVNATTAPAASSGFLIPLTNNSSSDERPRRRKDSSHRRTASASTQGHHHALSNSTTSASTEDSSHESQEGEGGSQLWKSGTSLSQMSQGHPSMAQKCGAQVIQQHQQHSHSQQRIVPSPYGASAPANNAAAASGASYRRSRGISDAPAPHSHYSHAPTPVVVNLSAHNSRSSRDEKRSRPGTATSGSRSGRDEEDEAEDRGRGRTKEKDTSIMGRIRSRSNSLTKGISKIIEYPSYLKSKMSSKRESKRLGAGGSSGVLAYSEHGHGNGSGEAFDGYNAAYTASTSTTTTASTAASPVSAIPPVSGHHHSKSSVILSTQHLHSAPAKKREHKRSLSAQPVLGHVLSPPPQRTPTASGAPTAFPRLRKPLTHKERDKLLQHRTSPMTKAGHDVLELWEDVDLDPRRSGIHPTQIQLTSTTSRFEPGVAFPRVEREREYAPAPAVPFTTERHAPRRR